MDHKMSESGFVGRDTIADSEPSDLQGWNELPLLETTADDAPSLAAVEASHVYDALPKDCIRLLRILPGEPRSEVCCEICQCILDEQTDYTALSYTWGAEPAHHSIRMNRKRVCVRKNLWRFLRQARESGGSLMTLHWVDALCIDQSNFKEREEQVQLMPRIYRNAARVLVCLGPAYQNSDLALRAVATPKSHWPSPARLLKLWSKAHRAAISALCHRSYFTRLWIFQELSLAKRADLMCGDRILALEALQVFLSTVKADVRLARCCERVEYKSKISSPAVSILGHVAQQSEQSTLWELLQATRHLHCLEVRDKVYALLGVARAGIVGIAADYTLPVPVLMNNILRNEHSIHPPRSIEEADNMCTMLTTLMGVDYRLIYECIDPYGCCPAPQGSELKLLDAIDLYPPPGYVCWASFYGHTHVQKLYLAIGGSYKLDLLMRAARIGASSTLKIMLANGQLNANWQNAVGRIPMHEAAEYGHAATAELMLSEYSALAAPRDNRSRTPLELAAQHGHEDVVKVFLKPKYLPIENVDSYLDQALTLSITPAIKGNDSAARLLVESGLINRRSAKTIFNAAKRYKLKGLLQSINAQMEKDKKSKDGR